MVEIQTISKAFSTTKQAVDVSHLLKDMGQILHRPDLLETEKAQQYGETLSKLQN